MVYGRVLHLYVILKLYLNSVWPNAATSRSFIWTCTICSGDQDPLTAHTWCSLCPSRRLLMMDEKDVLKRQKACSCILPQTKPCMSYYWQIVFDSFLAFKRYERVFWIVTGKCSFHRLCWKSTTAGRHLYLLVLTHGVGASVDNLSTRRTLTIQPTSIRNHFAHSNSKLTHRY